MKFKFKAGDVVEIINPNIYYYGEHGQIMYAFQKAYSDEPEIIYNVSFGATNDYFRENDLQLLEEVTNNEDSKISRVEQTHNNINEFRKKSGNCTPSVETSLSIIAQMLMEINETLVIICDKL